MTKREKHSLSFQKDYCSFAWWDKHVNNYTEHRTRLLITEVPQRRKEGLDLYNIEEWDSHGVKKNNCPTKNQNSILRGSGSEGLEKETLEGS